MKKMSKETKRWSKRTRVWKIQTEGEKEWKEKLEKEHVNKTLRELQEEKQIRDE